MQRVAMTGCLSSHLLIVRIAMPGTPLIRLLAILLIIQPLMGVDCYKDRPGCHSFLAFRTLAARLLFSCFRFQPGQA